MMKLQLDIRSKTSKPRWVKKHFLKMKTEKAIVVFATS